MDNAYVKMDTILLFLRLNVWVVIKYVEPAMAKQLMIAYYAILIFLILSLLDLLANVK